MARAPADSNKGKDVRMIASVVVMSALAACGSNPSTGATAGTTGQTTADPADAFVGTYSGSASRVLSCPDPGPAASGSMSIKFTKMTASQLSATATIPADSVGGTTSCGPLTFTVSGSTATLSNGGPCTMTSVGSLSASHQVQSGSASIANGVMTAGIGTAVTITSGSGTPSNCTAQANGTLSK